MQPISAQPELRTMKSQLPVQPFAERNSLLNQSRDRASILSKRSQVGSNRPSIEISRRHNQWGDKASVSKARQESRRVSLVSQTSTLSKHKQQRAEEAKK